LGKQISTTCSADYLYARGQELRLDHYIQTGVSYRDQLPSKNMVVATVQALLGAVWVDSGKSLSAVEAVVQHLGLLVPDNMSIEVLS
jgi:dsRNA-specific ribonuclease